MTDQKKPAPSPTAATIRASLRKELGKKNFGIPELHRIARIARAGERLLRAEHGVPLNEVKPSSESPNSMETFGAKVLRDLMPVLTKLMQPAAPTPIEPLLPLRSYYLPEELAAAAALSPVPEPKKTVRTNKKGPTP